nr:contactin-associated protein-like 2 [Meriones unguiculatus]
MASLRLVSPNCISGEGSANCSGLNDGQWHEVRFLAKENFAVLTIDGDEASAVRTNSPLQVKTGEKYFFGGFLNHMSNASHSALQPSFQGCMQLIQVDDQLVNLYEVAQRKPGSFANVTIDMCAIIDRKHCEQQLDNRQKLQLSMLPLLSCSTQMISVFSQPQYVVPSKDHSVPDGIIRD